MMRWLVTVVTCLLQAMVLGAFGVAVYRQDQSYFEAVACTLFVYCYLLMFTAWAEPWKSGKS